MLHTIDINDELAEMALKYFGLAGLDDQIVMHTGDACAVIPALDEIFDLVFIDGDKEQYIALLQACVSKSKNQEVLFWLIMCCGVEKYCRATGLTTKKP